jgi:hypothetical protein
MATQIIGGKLNFLIYTGTQPIRLKGTVQSGEIDGSTIFTAGRVRRIYRSLDSGGFESYSTTSPSFSSLSRIEIGGAYAVDAIQTFNFGDSLPSSNTTFQTSLLRYINANNPDTSRPFTRNASDAYPSWHDTYIADGSNYSTFVDYPFVPSYLSWKYGNAGGYFLSVPSGWNAVVPWGEIFCKDGYTIPGGTNTRIQIKSMDLWILTASTQKWTWATHTDESQGALYDSGFAGNANKGSLTVRDETSNGGGNSLFMENGYTWHYYTDRYVFNPADYGGFLARFQARLILDNPAGTDDRASAQYVANAGADYWRSYTQVFDNFVSSGGAGGGGFKKITNNWQNFTGTSCSPDYLNSNPPPAF